MELMFDKVFTVTNLTLNGNMFKIAAHKQLASLFAKAAPLEELNMRACGLENEGLVTTFEVLVELKRLKKIDYSNNGIFDKGIQSICPYIDDKHYKSHITALIFN